jgi:hypothetical protein
VCKHVSKFSVVLVFLKLFSLIRELFVPKFDNHFFNNVSYLISAVRIGGSGHSLGLLEVSACYNIYEYSTCNVLEVGCFCAWIGSASHVFGIQLG